MHINISLAGAKIAGTVDLSMIPLGKLEASHCECGNNFIVSHLDETVEVLVAPGAQSSCRQYNKSIEFIHAPHLIVKGDLCIAAVDIKQAVFLDHCEIHGDLILHGSHIGFVQHRLAYSLSLSIPHAKVHGNFSGRGLWLEKGLDGSFIQIEGDFDMAYNLLRGLRSRIGQSRNDQIQGPKEFCLWLRSSKIGGLLRLNSILLEGGMSLREAKIGASVYLNGTAINAEDAVYQEGIGQGGESGAHSVIAEKQENGCYLEGRLQSTYKALVIKALPCGRVPRLDSKEKQLASKIGASLNWVKSNSIDAQGAVIGGGFWWEVNSDWEISYASGTLDFSRTKIGSVRLKNIIVENISGGDSVIFNVSAIDQDIEIINSSCCLSMNGVKTGGGVLVSGLDEANESLAPSFVERFPSIFSMKGATVSGPFSLDIRWLYAWFRRVDGNVENYVETIYRSDVGDKLCARGESVEGLVPTLIDLSGSKITRFEICTPSLKDVRYEKLVSNIKSGNCKKSAFKRLKPFGGWDEKLVELDCGKIARPRLITSLVTIAEIELVTSQATFCGDADARVNYYKQEYVYPPVKKGEHRNYDPRFQMAFSGALIGFIAFLCSVLLYCVSGSKNIPWEEMVPGAVIFGILLILGAFFWSSWQFITNKATSSNDEVAHYSLILKRILDVSAFSGSFFLRLADFAARAGMRLVADEIYFTAKRRESKESGGVIAFMNLFALHVFKFGVRGRIWSLGFLLAFVLSWQLVLSEGEKIQPFLQPGCTINKNGAVQSSTPPAGDVKKEGGSEFQSQPSNIDRERYWLVDSWVLLGREVFGAGFGPSELWASRECQLATLDQKVFQLSWVELRLADLVTMCRMLWFIFLAFSLGRVFGLVRKHSLDGLSRT